MERQQLDAMEQRWKSIISVLKLDMQKHVATIETSVANATAPGLGLGLK